ncbi:MAG TPA: ABC transporter substrate-binding protein [Acetobacteraceae bacterium]|nr:ABC transporter substrate-binding protein [Acetobacteraceae bacterium]
MKIRAMLAAATALGIAGWLPATPARAAGTLVVSIAADPTGFDPEAVENNTSGFVMACVYDTLVAYKPGTTEPAPGLAQSWDISPDGLTYTFHLRTGVKFQDGTPFNAHTYVQTLDRQLKKSDPNYIYNTGPVESYIDFTFGNVASYSAVDDNTVQFKLKAPSAPFLTSLAMVWNGVVSYPAAAKWGKDFRNHPVGTGPFIFKEWRSRDQIALDANPNYWKGKVNLSHLVFKEYPDPQAALLALKRGETQIMGDVATQVVPALRGDPHIRLLTQPGLTVSGMAMPNDTAPFDDFRVRQALNYAVDKAAINKALYAGLAVTMNSPLPASQWGYDASLKSYPYDVAKARALLKQAGVKLPLRVELLTYNTPRGYNPAGPDLAVALQGYLRKVGVVASVRKSDMGAYLAEIRSGKYHGLFVTGWSGDNGDPDNFVGELFNSKYMPVGDTSHYHNVQADALMNRAVEVSDTAKRTAMYHQVQAIIMHDAPWLFVNSTLQVRAERTSVQGFRLNPTQMFFNMDQVSLTK